LIVNKIGWDETAAASEDRVHRRRGTHHSIIRIDGSFAEADLKFMIVDLESMRDSEIFSFLQQI
jgi:hypothetical protein